MPEISGAVMRASAVSSSFNSCLVGPRASLQWGFVSPVESGWHQNKRRRNADISRVNSRIARTFHLPTLDLNGGYNYNYSKSEAGFALFNRTSGPSGGLSLNMPLFQGGNIRRQARVASLQAMRNELLYHRQNTELGRQYRTAWRNYEVAVAAYKLEQENIRYAKENLDIQRARFRVGIATTLETREAENSYVQALVRFYTAAYNVKVSETLVLEIENELVK